MISVIIPCSSSVDLLFEQLDALTTMACPEPWEVVVVDNGFSDEVTLDDSESVAARLSAYRTTLPSFRVVRAVEMHSAAYARNVGVAASRGEKLAFLDADDVADSGWLAAMAGALDQHALVASRWDIDLLNGPQGVAARKNGQATGVRSYDHPTYYDHAGGCGLGVLRSAFKDVGGFDEEFRLLEDTDLTWRLQLAGYDLAFEPEAVVHIRFRQNNRASFRQAYGYGKYNVLLYKRYRAHGMPRLTIRDGVYTLAKQLQHLTWLIQPGGWPRYVRSLGHTLGRVGGSVAFLIWGI